MAERTQGGRMEEIAPALAEALGACMRLYAGLVVAACREFSCPPANAASWGPQAGVSQAEELLREGLEKLLPLPDKLARALVEVFYEDGQPHAFAAELFRLGPAPERPAPPPGVDPVVAEVSQLASGLNDWMLKSLAFFLECEDRYEPGPDFGQLEQVVQFRQHILRTGVTNRVKESRAPLAPSPPPVPEGTSGVMLAPEGPSSQIMLAPAQPAPMLSNIMLAPAAPTSNIMLAPGSSGDMPIAPVPASPLTDFVSEQLVRAPQVRPREGPVQEAPPRLEIIPDYFGFAKNPAGKIGHAGVLWINNAGGGELSGTVSCTNENLQLNPTSFTGDHNRLTFWLDPAEMPQPDGVVLVRTAQEERRLPVSRLVPTSRVADLPLSKKFALLLAPGLLGSVYLTFVLYMTGRFMESTVRKALGLEVGRYFVPGNYVSLRGAGVGALDLDVLPRAEACALLLFLVAWLVPLAVTKIFARFPRHEQKSLGLAYMLAMVLPVLWFAAMWKSPLLAQRMFNHPELRYVNFRNHMVGFSCINLLASGYLFMSVAGFFQRFLNELGRVLVPLILFAAYIILVGLLVYGRSWFALG